MDGHDRKNRLLKTCSDCGNIFSEKDSEGPCYDCANKVRNEETCLFARVLQKEVVKKTGNIVKNRESSNPTLRLSDDPGDHQGHDSVGSDCLGDAHPGSSSARDTYAVDDYQGSISPTSTSFKGNYNLASTSACQDSPRGVDSLGLKSPRNASHSEDGYSVSICTSHASHPGHDSWTSNHIGRHTKSYNHKNQCRSKEDDRVNSFKDRWNPQSHDDYPHDYHFGKSLARRANRVKTYNERKRKGEEDRENRSHYSSGHVVKGRSRDADEDYHDLKRSSRDDYKDSRRGSFQSSSLEGHALGGLNQRQRREEKRVNRSNYSSGHGSLRSLRDDYEDYRLKNHRSSSLKGRASESLRTGVASGLSYSHDDHRYDDHPSSSQARDASHGLGQDLVAKSRDDYHDHKHNDHPSSSPARNASHIRDLNRERGKAERYALTTGQGEDRHPSSRSKRHAPHVRSNKRNKNMFTNERNFRSGRRQQDDEFSNIRPSTVTTTRAERDEEPFDICNMTNLFASIELPPPSQINEPDKEIQNLMPGMFLLKKWLTQHEQVELVKKCRDLGLGEGGFFQPSFRDGKKMRLRMMCLGMNWNHRKYIYEEIREHDKARPPPIPVDFVPLVHRAIEDCHNKLRKDHNIRTEEELLKDLPGLDPDVCIVNFYEESGRLGLHQDKDESRASLAKGLPVVSFTIGDSAEFLYGNKNKSENLNKIILESGDVLIFGGKSRLVFHGISRLCPDTAPRWLTQNTCLRRGRINLTFRQIYI